MSNRKLLLSVLLLALMLLTIPPTLVHALKANYGFDRETYYQGEGGSVKVDLYNDNPLFQWNIKEVGIQFDWQKTQQTWYSSVVNTNIASGQSYSLTLNFGIDSSVTAGSHSFEIQYIASSTTITPLLVDPFTSTMCMRNLPERSNPLRSPSYRLPTQRFPTRTHKSMVSTLTAPTLKAC